MRLAAVLLAAGESRRLGRPKQLLPYRGEPLLRAVATEACASRCEGVAVVVGGGEPAIEACLRGLPVLVLANPGWAEGIASSIRTGVAWAEREAYDGVVLLLSDQFALTASHVDALARAGRAGTAIVASRYGGALGVPAFFARAVFPALLALRGERGAKDVLRSDPRAVAVDWPDGAGDVDTPEDAARLPP